MLSARHQSSAISRIVPLQKYLQESGMASRLSEQAENLISDGGISWAQLTKQPDVRTHDGLLVDLGQLLQSPSPISRVRELPPQALYYSLLELGLEDAISQEVMTLISPEQLTRLLDYDAWEEDSLVPERAIRFLQVYREHSNDMLFRRFRTLEEEFQLGLLGGRVRIYTSEQLENMNSEVADQLNRLPGEEIAYELVDCSQEVETLVQNMIEGGMAENMDYVISLLSHAAYMPPNESEQLLRQFRQARLEEDGFVSYSDSLSMFRPLNPSDLITSSDATSSSAIALAGSWPKGFLDAVLEVGNSTWSDETRERIVMSLASVANSLCAATKLEMHDIKGHRQIALHLRSLVGMALEFASNRQIDNAVSLLSIHHPATLFRTALGLVEILRRQVIQAISALGQPEHQRLVNAATKSRYGVVQNEIDINLLTFIGLENAELLKGLFNRFPIHSQTGELRDSGTCFAPIDCLAAFGKFAVDVQSVVLQLRLLANGSGFAPTELERGLTNLFVLWTLGERDWQCRPLHGDSVRQFAAKVSEWDTAALEKTLAAYRNDLEKVLSQNATEALSLNGSNSELPVDHLSSIAQVTEISLELADIAIVIGKEDQTLGTIAGISALLEVVELQ